MVHYLPINQLAVRASLLGGALVWCDGDGPGNEKPPSERTRFSKA